MRAPTANRWLFGIFAFLIVALSLMSIGGDDEARSILVQVVVVASFVGVLSYLVYRFRVVPRRAVFSDQGRGLALSSVAGDPLGLLGSRFEVLTRHAAVRDIESTATGTWNGREVVVADYWYAPTSNTQVDDYVRVVCALFPVPASWPRLLVVPERLATLIGDTLTGAEPDTEWEEFNRSYAVRAADRRFSSAVLDARMIEWILGLGRNVGFEILDGRLLCFVPRATEGDVRDALETGDAFLARIPHAAQAWYG